MPDIDMQTANGFVVVTTWNHARTPHGSFAYDCYERLADAVAAYRDPGSSFKPHGIFPAMNGLPIGPALSAEVIAAVKPGQRKTYGLREWCPVSPEHMQLKERARLASANGRAA